MSDGKFITTRKEEIKSVLRAKLLKVTSEKLLEKVLREFLQVIFVSIPSVSNSS